MSNQNADIPEGYRMTELGPLPEEWELVVLKDVAKVSAGGSAPQGDEYFNGTKPFIRVQHLDVGGTWVRRWDLITEKAIDDYGLRLFPAGTIVLPKSGASIRLEKRAMLSADAYIVSHLAAVVPYDSIDKDFLFYWLRHKRLASDKADGYPTLSLTELKKIRILCPPLPEQEKIALVLVAVQQAKEKTEGLVEALRELKMSLMKHLFTYGPVPVEEAERVELKETEVGLIPKNWKVVSLGEVCEFMQYGTSQRCNREENGIPVLRIPNVLQGRIDTSDMKYTRLPDKSAAKLMLSAGDILFVRTNGRREYVGRCAVFRNEFEKTLFASYLIRVRLRKGASLPSFIESYATTEAGRQWLSGRASSASDGKFNINTQILKSVKIGLPPFEDQKEIEGLMAALDARVTTEENRKQGLEQLFRTLLHDLMTAKIRVNNLNIKFKRVKD